jgi:CheY-like chemotaxis protein
MRRKILVADSDEKLQQAFSTIFSKEDYEILYASNGKEVERMAEKLAPDIYIVNVNLPKINGIELYKKFQKEKVLDKATFFFLKDERDRTELIGYQASGVIEKPINFFRVFETITNEDEVIVLTDEVEEEIVPPKAPPREAALESRVEPRGMEDRWAGTPKPEKTESRQPEPPKQSEPERAPARYALVEEAAGLQAALGDRLRDAMGTAASEMSEETPALALEAQLRAAITQVMEEASRDLAGKLAPVLATYVEDYVKRILLEVAEKVIREEIDKLLKETTA